MKTLTEQLEARGWRLKLLKRPWRKKHKGKTPEYRYWCKGELELIFDDALREERIERGEIV